MAIPLPAASDDAKAKAALHYRQGKAFFDAKQYDRAIAEYQQAYAIDKQPGHLFNIARAYHLKADLKAAIGAYQGYLAAEPNTSRAKEVRDHIVALTAQLADEATKLDEAARRKLLEDKRAKATAFVKQAEAYARTGAWVKAGDEYRAAAEADGDPAHLLAAAEAYSKQPDLAKQRDAYAAYLEKIPGPESDPIRTKLAEVTSAIEKAEQEARARRESSNEPLDPKTNITKRARANGQAPMRLGFGGELRGGYQATSDFTLDNLVSPAPVAERAPNKGGIHVIVGAFGDIWLWPAQRLQLGLRGKLIKVGYRALDCSDPALCPKEINVVLVGPAAALETTLVKSDDFNAHFLVGGSVGFGAKKAFTTGDDREIALNGFNTDLGIELGFGLRFGRVSVDAIAQLSVTQLSSELDFGNARGFGLALGWSSRR